MSNYSLWSHSYNWFETKDFKHDQLILTLFIVVFVIDSSLSVSYSFHFTLCNYFVPFGNVNVAVMV